MKVKVVVIIAALTSPLFEASAQEKTPEASAKWSISVGIDPRHLDLRTRDPGVDARFIGTLTRSWATGFERLRLKAELMGGVDAPRGFHDTDGTLCGGCDVNISRSFASAGVGATFQLLRSSRFSPYLTGGTGIYHNRSAAQSPLDCTDSYCITGGKPYYFRQSRETSLGLNGGIGINFRAGGREYFVQQSAHAFDFRQGLNMFPLSVGIRF